MKHKKNPYIFIILVIFVANALYRQNILSYNPISDKKVTLLFTLL